MDTLQINLFGHVTVIHPNSSRPLSLPRSSQALLAFILLQHSLVPRDVLMDLFWTDHPPNRARSSLTTALWRLRQLLEPEDVTPGTYLLTSKTGEIGFNWESGHWLDIDRFEKQSNDFLRKPSETLCEYDIHQIEDVLNLYRGELLEGIFDDWALRERERIHLNYVNCLTRLMTFYSERCHFEQSIAYGREILLRDPLREEIHRSLMRVYLESDQRSLAIRQYEICRTLLNEELGIPPLEETEMLYRQILDSQPISRVEQNEIALTDINQLAYEFQSVRRSFGELACALTRMSHVIDKLVNHNDGNS